MKWIDAEDIGIALAEKFPDVDPLTIRFTDLRERVLALDGFDDDPKDVERAEARSDSDGVARGMARTRSERLAACSVPACAPTSSRSWPASPSPSAPFCRG